MNKEKKRIAALFYGDPNKPRGAFNASFNRIKYLIESDEYDVDVFLLSSYPTSIMQKLRHCNKVKRVESIIHHGVKFNMLWIPFSFVDYVLQSKCHGRPYWELHCRKKYYKLLAGYDLISAHSTECGEMAFDIKKEYGTPYVVTWHGGDIHTTPFFSKKYFSVTKNIIESADMNFFVSHKLMELSSNVTSKGNKDVLYNGVDKQVFLRYPEDKIMLLREKYNISSKCKHVSFVGNFIDVKNVKCLPEIFANVSRAVDFDITFYFVGSGQYEGYLREMSEKLKIDAQIIKDVTPSQMPEIYNCMDLIVLPSVNEGLPLVSVEALACGTNMIGARVGGIPEVVGLSNTIEHGPDFNKEFTALIIKHLVDHIPQQLPSQFDWNVTTRKEIELCNECLKSNRRL